MTYQFINKDGKVIYSVEFQQLNCTPNLLTIKKMFEEDTGASLDGITIRQIKSTFNTDKIKL